MGIKVGHVATDT